MLDVKVQALKNQSEADRIKHTDLIVAVYNSSYGPYLKKHEKYPYKLKDFLPKNLIKKENITEAEKSKRWSSAGHDMMAVVREHERDVRR